MEPEYHFLGGRITEPVCFGPVSEGLIFGSEAVLFGKCWVCFIEIDGDVPVPNVSINRPSWMNGAVWGRSHC